MPSFLLIESTTATANPLRLLANRLVFAILSALCLAAVISPASCRAENSEYSVKAAYLLNFVRYVVWPDGLARRKNGKVAVCSWKTSPFKEAATELEKHPFNGMRVDFETITDKEAIPLCDILFFATANADELTTVSGILETNNVVSVTEKSLLGILNFQIVDNQVRFDCNLTLSQKTGVRLGSQLLKLAQRVEGEAP